jgi:hypothetical protein
MEGYPRVPARLAALQKLLTTSEPGSVSPTEELSEKTVMPKNKEDWVMKVRWYIDKQSWCKP